MTFNKDNKALISIVIPVYNVEKYIRKCVDSVICQTYKNLEIILVDDGSTDECPRLCDEYTKQDNRVIVLHKKNGGLSDARNAGIDIAKGEYFIFVDSDDYISERFVETLYGTVCQNSTLLAMCNHICVDETGTIISSKNDTYVTDEVISVKEINQRVMRKSTHMCVVAWNKIYHRSLWKSIRYPKGRLCEDEYVFCDVVDQCERIACSSSHEYFYRVRNGSIMRSASYKLYEDMVSASKQRLAYLKKKGWKDLEQQCYVSLLDEVMMSYCHCHTIKEKRWYTNILKEINQYISSQDVYRRLTCVERIKLFGCNHFPRLINQMGLIDQKIRGKYF